MLPCSTHLSAWFALFIDRVRNSPFKDDLVLQVQFSECGERFAGVGEGGVVATWRLDAPRFAASDTGPLGRADWCHQVRSPGL